MKFSICIPNYNYESYLGQTIDSVLSNTYKNFELVIADNASTDGSVEVVKQIQKTHANIKLQINSCNVGFASNLDYSGQMAGGDYMIMLSSDDLMSPEVLSLYNNVIKTNPKAVICSSWDVVDSKGNKIGFSGPNKKLWTLNDIDPALSKELACDVYRIKAHLLLQRCLKNMASPFNFCTTAYAREWYLKVGGYGGGRIINPDKWFHWKLLMVTDEAIFIDRPLFCYRWHNQNQTSQQAAAGHLKYMIDEYRNTMEVTEEMLKYSAISKTSFIKSFIKNDVYRHGLGEFSKGRWLKSLRIYFFGLSVYPARMILSIYFVFYTLALLTMPVGSAIAHLFFSKRPFK